MNEFAALIDDLPGDIRREVVNELCHGWRAQEVLVAKEQLEIAQAQPERTWVNGMGRVRLSISPTAYHFWGQRLGYACWRDKQFLAEFERDNPEARVRSVAPRTTLRVEGLGPGAGGRGPRDGIVLANRFGGVESCQDDARGLKRGLA